jgi:molecular chaperone GrpE
MTVRIPIVDRRSSRASDGVGAPVAASDPGAGLNEEVLTQLSSQPPPRPRAATEDAVEAPPGPAGTLVAERDEWRERCRRTAAELENLRRVVDQRVENEVFRLERERLERWLELGDAFDRARAQAAAAPAEWRAGLDDVARLFEDLMAKAGARRMEEAATFDPAVHEAVSTMPAPGRPDGTIVATVRAGWLLGERLLRPAGVVVVRNATA